MLTFFVMVTFVGGGLVAWRAMESHSELKDLNGNSVSLESGDMPSKEVIKDMRVREVPGIRLTIPSVKLNVAIGELSAVDGVITPPTFTQAYMVRNMGVDLAQAATGSVYVVTHSVREGLAPGNYLINVDVGKSTLKHGATIHIGDRTYSVNGTMYITKNDLASTPAVWKSIPGRLVLITCLQRTHGNSVKNVVITADLDQ